MSKDGSADTTGDSRKSQAAAAREERLKAALRANLQRRKLQGRARRKPGETDKN
jgi:hypothetical protein